MDTDELRAWLRVTQAPGVSEESIRRLLAAFGSPQAVLEGGPAAWRHVAGHHVVAGLDAPPDAADALWASTVKWLAAEPGRRQVLSWGDPAYPESLLNIADPPPLLYAQGRVEWLAAPSVAIVGSRHATPVGKDNARAFAAHLSRAGLTIVSGMALGIDGAAHEGGLEGPGSTVAVVGTGLDRVYPQRHRNLAHRIADDGLLLSEFPLGTPPLAFNFPRRNRLIAGLSLGTLVEEAAVQSGSLITARLAMEGGRDVFAIPGSIHAPQSRGCHRLIKDGAKLVETADDILLELRWPAAASSAMSASPDAPSERADELDGGQDAALLRLLGDDPATLDALVARSGWPAAELNVKLLSLEMDNRVARLPGGLFQRRHLG